MATVGDVCDADIGAQFHPTDDKRRAVSADFLALEEVFFGRESLLARLSGNPWQGRQFEVAAGKVVGHLRRGIVMMMFLLPLSAAAQARPVEDGARSLKSLQDQIEVARRQRLELEAASERVLAVDISDRAKRLAMAGEAGSLQRLEVLLDSAQARLLAQRDRLRSLREATATNSQAVVVVMLRADAIEAGEYTVFVLIDGTQVRAIDYKGDAGRALTRGAAVELYRGAIEPVEHKVLVRVAGRGLAAGETIAVPAGAQQVNYLEFVLTGGRLVSSAWVNKVPAF
jgi:hypothetical protein